MTRPLKKKNGVVAGMARSGGVRQSPIGSSHADGDGQVRQVSNFPHVILIVNNIFPCDFLAPLDASPFCDARYRGYTAFCRLSNLGG